MRKIRDLVVYADPRYYCAFPSIVRRPDGELIVAFRRAPDRRARQREQHDHGHPGQDAGPC